MRAEALEKLAAELFLHHAGDIDVTRKVFVPGDDHTDQLREAEAAVARLVQRLERVPPGGATGGAILARLREHETTITRLHGQPLQPNKWINEPTGEKSHQLWARLEPTERGKLMRDAHVRILWAPKRIAIELGDLTQLARTVELAIPSRPGDPPMPHRQPRTRQGRARDR